MTGIRVLRIIEHVFDSPEQAETIMAGWTSNLNLPHERMRSTVMPFEAFEWQEDGGNQSEPDATTDLLELRSHKLDLAALRKFKNSTKLDIYVREPEDG